MKEVIFNGRELATDLHKKKLKISVTNGFCSEGHWGTRKLPVVKGSKRGIPVGYQQCRQAIVNVGFKAVGSAYWNSTLSSKARIREMSLRARSCRLRMTGIRQPIRRPDTDSKSYKFPFSDCSSRPAEPTGFRAASRWKLKYVYENGSSPLAIRRLSRTVIASQQRTGKLHLNTREEMLAYL